MATTALISEQKSILWRIPNFAEVRQSEKLVNEQLYRFEMNVGLSHGGTATPILWKCFLRIMDKERGAQTKDSVGLLIVPESLPPELSESHARIRFQIDAKGKGRHYYLDGLLSCPSVQKLATEAGRGYRDAVPRFSKETPFLTADGALEILITVTVYYPQAQNAALAEAEARYQDRFTSNFRSQLTDIRKQPLNLSSVATNIVSKDDVQFPVDRVILAARSFVFRAMFQTSMNQVQNGLVEVKDMDSKPLEVLHHFLHTGELTKNWRKEGIIEGLVYGAHKYMLKDLLEFLDAVLGMVCTNTNCGKLLGLAKTFGLEKAQGQLLDYYKKNLANNVDEVLRFAEETAKAARLMDTPPPESAEDGEQPPRKKSKRN